MVKKFFKYSSGFMLLMVVVYFVFFSRQYPVHVLLHSFRTGDSLDSFNGVVVYNNGADYGKSYGRHYSTDSSFYYGKKWQCVEFVKRYYHDYLHFDFADGMGHAKDFFDRSLGQGAMNKRRELLQFINGEDEKPRVNDILVFDGAYGHVAIVTRVGDEEVEVIQQNIYMTPRQCFVMKCVGGKYTVGESRRPLGWLRKREKSN